MTSAELNKLSYQQLLTLKNKIDAAMIQRQAEERQHLKQKSLTWLQPQVLMCLSFWWQGRPKVIWQDRTEIRQPEGSIANLVRSWADAVVDGCRNQEGEEEESFAI